MRASTRRRRSISFACVLTVLLGAVELQAQTRQVTQPTGLSDSAVVSVVTVLPGDRLYSLFGHTIIRIRDPASGLDRGFNFGTFDFPRTLAGGAGFVARFAYGRLDYKLSASDRPLRSVAGYWQHEGRPSIEQTLAISPLQRDSLFALLMENARPENAGYRYDFFFDNCSTRPRDALENVLGPELSVGVDDPGRSFRQLLDPYLVGHPGTDFAMDVGLGPPADREASAREALFLPEELMHWLAAAELGSAGGRRPLVTRTETLTWAPGAGSRERTTPWPAVLAWSLALGLVLLTLQDRRSGRGSRRWIDGILFSAVGTAGCVLAFLTFVSLHAVTRGNLNLLWAIPTHLVVGIVLLAGRTPSWLRPYMLATLALALLFLFGIPFLPQEIPLAVVGIVVGVAARAVAVASPKPDLSQAAEGRSS